jgi:hypothetical protein
MGMSATPNLPATHSAATQPPPPDAPDSTDFSPGPDHRDLYLLVIGIVLGILIGPRVLGSFSPATYDKWFVGTAELQNELTGAMRQVTDKLNAFNEQTAERQAKLRASGASPEAMLELNRALRTELKAIVLEERVIKARYLGGPVPRSADELPLPNQPAGTDELMVDGKILKAERAHLDWLAARLTAIILATAVMMVLETLIDPRPRVIDGAAFWPRLRNGLATARYALMAVWVALALARPLVLLRVPGVFFLLLVLVAVAVAAVPLRRRARG